MAEPRKVILVVDDEAGVRDMLRWCLRESDYDIKVARDGEEAVAVVAAGGVDLVVTDLTMPRLGGFGVLEAMAGKLPRTPVIVVTGFGTVEMAVHAMRSGAADFLLKPYDVGYLTARIRETLEAQARPGSDALS